MSITPVPIFEPSHSSPAVNCPVSPRAELAFLHSAFLACRENDKSIRVCNYHHVGQTLFLSSLLFQFCELCQFAKLHYYNIVNMNLLAAITDSSTFVSSQRNNHRPPNCLGPWAFAKYWQVVNSGVLRADPIDVIQPSVR